MVVKKRKILWDTAAAMDLKEIYLYIKKESLPAAHKVRQEIFSTIRKLSTNPLMFASDPLKESNDGSYRAFFIYSIRIAYRITEEKILILRLRHTSREPEEY